MNWFYLRLNWFWHLDLGPDAKLFRKSKEGPLFPDFGKLGNGGLGWPWNRWCSSSKRWLNLDTKNESRRAPPGKVMMGVRKYGVCCRVTDHSQI